MTNENIAAMAAWTLEDFQEDPLAAIEQVRALATAYQNLQRERDTQEKNETLTLDDLRQMVERCEGVYIAHTDGKEVFRGQKYCAAVLDTAQAFGSMGTHIQAIYGDKLTMREDDYGKTWLAYRQPPKEGQT